MLDREEATRLLAAHGQAHVLRWFDSLDSARQRRLLEQVSRLDLSWLERALSETSRPAPPLADLAPRGAVVPVPGGAEARDAQAAGEAALRNGRVAALLAAGGQGARLGFDGPKGLFAAGAVSGRSLYQMHAERLVALGRRYGVVPPLYLMTSRANDEATRAYLVEHSYFGVPVERVQIFSQGEAPAVDESGRLLLEAPDRIALAPNGNGGVFAALLGSGAFEHMRALGVDTLSFVHVDNPLAPSCEPQFVGHHLLARSDFSCKAIKRQHAGEAVGCFALVGGRPRVIEYTELPPDLAREVTAEGQLLFSWANPGIFLWSRAFAEAQAARDDLPCHRAHKRIPFIDDEGRLVQPAGPNGYKLELFAMDTLAAASRAILVGAEREEEFAPIKNAAGDDSPVTARALTTRKAAAWIRQAGGSILDEGAQIEISPLFALDAGELAARLPPGFTVRGDIFLAPDLALAES